MKTLLALFLLTAGAAFAQSNFPGIKVIMTPEEFARAGLSVLTPDQLGVIDAAIIRHYTHTVKKAATEEAVTISQQVVATEKKKSWLSHFGIPEAADTSTPTALSAHCTGWVGGNSFALDNGQVWEGIEPITVEIANRDIEIQPRPLGGFALVVEGKNTTIRVRRVK
jgi:hypothetical protein